MYAMANAGVAGMLFWGIALGLEYTVMCLDVDGDVRMLFNDICKKIAAKDDRDVTLIWTS